MGVWMCKEALCSGVWLGGLYNQVELHWAMMTIWVIVQWFVVLQRYDVSGWCSQAAGSHWAMVRWGMMIFFFFFFCLHFGSYMYFFFFFLTKQYKEQKMVWGRIYEGWVWFVVRLGIGSGTWYLLMFSPIYFSVCLMHVCHLLGGGVWICMLVVVVLVCTVYVVQVLGFVCGC